MMAELAMMAVTATAGAFTKADAANCVIVNVVRCGGSVLVSVELSVRAGAKCEHVTMIVALNRTGVHSKLV